ncbi:MAG: phage minor head protein, partial [Thermodesulfobacteriota bacterium]
MSLDLDLKPLPFEEAVEAFRDTAPISSQEAARLGREARSRSFFVAGVTREDILAGLYESLDKVLAEGKSFGEWKKEAKNLFAAQGWEPGGHRLKTIFLTNVLSAYSAGRYKQMTDPDVAGDFPYWRYVAVKDRRTRPAHAAMHGRVFPADHPVWETWYPPNGFNCRCQVEPLTKRQAERMGVTVETEDPTGGLVEPKMPDGTVLPARPLMPD